ncbi:MAG: hypothetical protein R2708_27010 [Vicinamibacterales bacterium]
MRGIAVAGASLGASVALLAAADAPVVRGVALLSLSSDYRGVRVDGALRSYGGRPMLLLASTEDPLAARTLRGLVAEAIPGRNNGCRWLPRTAPIPSAIPTWPRRWWTGSDGRCYSEETDFPCAPIR